MSDMSEVKRIQRPWKNQAYEILIGKFEEVHPAATRDVVTKKNSPRIAYKKEMVIVNESIRSGAEDEYINYKPTL